MTTDAVRARVGKLAPSAGRVGSRLTELAQQPQEVHLQVEEEKELFGLLADDLRKIEGACAKADKADFPKVVTDGDAHNYEQAIQVAHLAVFGAAVNLAATRLLDAECDPHVFLVLGRALNSAMTGSGVEAKKLHGPPLTPNTPEPSTQQFRAKLVCLVELVEDKPDEVSSLYDAAEKHGGDRKKARQVVADARATKLKDDTFLQLRKYWKPLLEAEVRAGKKASDLLDP